MRHVTRGVLDAAQEPFGVSGPTKRTSSATLAKASPVNAAAPGQPHTGRSADAPIRGPRPLEGAASIAGLLADPTVAGKISLREIPSLVTQLTSEQAAIAAILVVLTTRLLEASAPPESKTPDRLLSADEVADALGVTKRWVQRRARRLPFSRQLSQHAVRYSESGLRRWLENRSLRGT
jgi:predicted DNA-binding transcriptional regulator AlpA